METKYERSAAESSIRKMIEDIDISINPCADEVEKTIGEAIGKGELTLHKGKYLLDMAVDAVRIQKRRMHQASVLTRSQSMRLG